MAKEKQVVFDYSWKIVKAILIIGIAIFYLNYASAIGKPDYFINYTAEKIYNSCLGGDLIKTENGHVTNYPSGSYTLESIKQYISQITKYEFKEHKWNTTQVVEEGNEGLGVIKCGENRLDIIGTTYYWNDIEIIPPSKIEQSTINQNVSENSFIKIGDVSFSLLGGISIISVSFISVTALSIAGIFLFIKKKKKISLRNYTVSINKKS